MIRQLPKDEALAHLKDMVAWDSHPTLDDPQLQRILETARRPDINKKAPNDAEWTETYDLDAAAQEAWLRKAGKVAGDYTFAADDSKLDRSDVIKHCQDMAKMYGAKIAPHATKNAVNSQTRTASDEFELLILQEAEEI